MSWYTLGWLLLAAAIVTLEATALLRHEPDGTLSRHIWALRGKRGTWRWWLLALATAWLSGHFVFGW